VGCDTAVYRRTDFHIYFYWGIVWVQYDDQPRRESVALAPAFRNLDASLEESVAQLRRQSGMTLIRIVIPLMMPAIWYRLCGIDPLYGSIRDRIVVGRSITCSSIRQNPRPGRL